MATILRLTDGTTSLNLDDRSNYRLRYGGLMLGPPSRLDDVRLVTWVGWIQGSSLDDLIGNQQALVKMLREARNFQERHWGRYVRFEYQQEGATELTTLDVLGYMPGDKRSESRLELEPIESGMLDQCYAPARLTLICRAMARGAESELVAATTLDNLDTATYVMINGAGIDGDAQALARIWLKNNSAQTYDGFRIGLLTDLRGSGIAPAPVLDATDEVSYETGATEVADASARNDVKVRLAFSITDYAVAMDGDDVITVPFHSSLTTWNSDQNDEFTVEMFVYFDEDTRDEIQANPVGLLTLWDQDGDSDLFAFGVDDQRIAYYHDSIGPGICSYKLYGHAHFKPGVWYHLAWTKRIVGKACDWRIYINGFLDKAGYIGEGQISNNKSSQDWSGFSSAWAPVKIGDFVDWHDICSRVEGMASAALRGRIAEIRISDILRYTDEFIPPTARFTSDGNTVALWHISAGSGTVIADASANANHGTLTGGLWVTGPLDPATLENRRGTWAVPESLFEHYAGAYNVYARVKSAADDPDDIRFRCRWSNGPWWSSDKKRLGAVGQWELVLLGRIDLPWTRVQETWIADNVFGSNTLRQFEFYSQHRDATDILDIDYFLFLPVDQGFWAAGVDADIGPGKGQIFSSIDASGRFTTKTGATMAATLFAADAVWEWQPPALTPSKTAYLVVSFDRAQRQNVAADTIDVTVRYMPLFEFLE